MSEWKRRCDAGMPYQEWRPFGKNEIVQVRSAYHPDVPDNIGPAATFWWGYEEEFGRTGEGVIVKARALSRPRT